MKTIYFIRHGRPAFPTNETWCIGRTDLPLSREGEAQMRLTTEAPGHIKFDAIFSSSLSRAAQSARIIAGKEGAIICDSGLNELYQGDWDGLPFSEIKLRWPELYEARGADRTLLPPGAETEGEGAGRACEALERILKTGGENIAVVAHRSIINALLGKITGESAKSADMPYGAVCAVSFDGASFKLILPAALPYSIPDRTLINLWHERQGTPENVRAHEYAVTEKALELAAGLKIPVDMRLLEAAALVHDIMRVYPDHALRGAKFLRKEGFGQLADIVEVHHGCGPEDGAEKALLCYADKLISGTREVTIEERFEESRKKCVTDEAKAAHERRYKEALELKKYIEENSRGDKE